MKKFFTWFLALMPFSAGAIAPLVIGGAVGILGIAGFSIYRTASPVTIEDAFNFFSSCWTCQVFSDVMLAMSNLLPNAYKAIGSIVIPMAASLTAVFFAWRITSSFFNNKFEDAWKLTGNFGTHFVKLSLLIALLLFPLPRFITNVIVEPLLSIGTSLDYVVTDNGKFGECMVASAIADPVSISQDAALHGAFSPNLRHQLACEVANVHQITGLGLTAGWTMMNMSFNADYMHKLMWSIPIFPNIPILFSGLLIFVLYFCALLPIPLYFLEVFIKLSMDLIMLPLMLMAWVFDKEDWPIFPEGGRTIKNMINDLVSAVIGISLTVIFLTFSLMFLNAAFGSWDGAMILQTAIANNDSKILMDGLMMQNNSLITITLMGIFIAMFMIMIPQLIKTLFNIQISDKYYETAKKDVSIVWKNLKKWATSIKK